MIGGGFSFKECVNMDFYKNVDKLGGIGNGRDMSAKGVQYSVVTDMTDEPVTIHFFKEHSRVDFDNDDTLMHVYLKAARQMLEKWSQLSFGVKTMSLTAERLPNNYRLMFGKVDSITTAGFTNKGDILKEGGIDIDIEYTTLDWVNDNDVIKVAICRQAEHLYSYRGTAGDPEFIDNEAKIMLDQYRNITFP